MAIEHLPSRWRKLADTLDAAVAEAVREIVDGSASEALATGVAASLERIAALRACAGELEHAMQREAVGR